MGPVSSTPAPWRILLQERPALLGLANCRQFDDHARVLSDLCDGLDPYADRYGLVRSLPAPDQWQCVGDGFRREFPCGCVLTVVGS